MADENPNETTEQTSVGKGIPLEIKELRSDVKVHHDEAISVIESVKKAARELENELAKLRESTQEKLRTADQYAEEINTNRESMNGLAADVTKHHDETVASIDENKKMAESCASHLLALKGTAEENSQQVIAARSAAEEGAKAVAEKTEEVEKNRDSTKRFLDDIEKNRNDAITLLETIKKHEANTKLIADRAEEKDKTVSEYQEQLKELTEVCESLKTRIEGLLPGATSAGLASAFETRKNDVRSPKILWTVLHLLSILAFVAVGVYVLVYRPEITTFKGLIFYALKKSPVLVALILLEEFSRRNYNIALRLEEDYGYKEVLSRSFEGYRKQMETIDQSSDKAVSKLSSNLLESLAKEPGRLIDKEKRVGEPSMDFIDQCVRKAKDVIGKKED